MSKTIQHEKGKADVITDGPNSARQVPEGEAGKETGAKDGGFINGQPTTKEEVERSTESTTVR